MRAACLQVVPRRSQPGGSRSPRFQVLGPVDEFAQQGDQEFHVILPWLPLLLQKVPGAGLVVDPHQMWERLHSVQLGNPREHRCQLFGSGQPRRGRKRGRPGG